MLNGWFTLYVIGLIILGVSTRIIRTARIVAMQSLYPVETESNRLVAGRIGLLVGCIVAIVSLLGLQISGVLTMLEPGNGITLPVWGWCVVLGIFLILVLFLAERLDTLIRR